MMLKAAAPKPLKPLPEGIKNAKGIMAALRDTLPEERAGSIGQAEDHLKGAVQAVASKPKGLGFMDAAEEKDRLLRKAREDIEIAVVGTGDKEAKVLVKSFKKHLKRIRGALGDILATELEQQGRKGHI